MGQADARPYFAVLVTEIEAKLTNRGGGRGR